MRVAEPHALPADDESADLAVSNLAVAGAADPGAAAEEMARVLAPGGTAMHHGAAARNLGRVPRPVPRRAARERQARSRWPPLDRHVASLPDAARVASWLEQAGLVNVGVDVERWEILFKSSREFLFAPLVELGPLSAVEAARRRRRRHAGRLLLHEGGDRHLLQGPSVRDHRRRRGRLGPQAAARGASTTVPACAEQTVALVAHARERANRAERALRNFSRQDYENMIGAGILGEDEHVELIGGQIVAMSPEGPVHAGAIDLCAEALRRVFGARSHRPRATPARRRLRRRART